MAKDNKKTPSRPPRWEEKNKSLHLSSSKGKGNINKHEFNKLRTMNTAILLFILIVIAIAIFSFGLIIGSRSMCKRLADATAKAIAKSSLSVEQQIELLEKIKEYAKKYE